MTVIVYVTTALICFTSQLGGTEECHPVLIGESTPRGNFVINRRITDDPGYGGDVLQFKEDATSVYAIHRVYLLNPKEKRAERLKSDDPARRRITNGCINVDGEVYSKLVDCCSRNGALLVK
jgi:hypothetical protein